MYLDMINLHMCTYICISTIYLSTYLSKDLRKLTEK